MRIVGILSVQTVLILGLDLYFDTRLGLWLLYFLPLLGSARIPSIRVTVVCGILLSSLMLVTGLGKMGGEVPWMEVFVPRALGAYALGLTAVFLVRGKQFGSRAMNAFAEAASQTQSQDEASRRRGDLNDARQRLEILCRQLVRAQRAQDQEVAGKLQGEIEQLLDSLRLSSGGSSQ